MTEQRRHVVFWEYARNNKEGEFEWIKGEEQRGIFHQFGMDFNVVDISPAQYSTAIIECEDGQLKNVPVEHVRFVDNESPSACRPGENPRVW